MLYDGTEGSHIIMKAAINKNKKITLELVL